MLDTRHRVYFRVAWTLLAQTVFARRVRQKQCHKQVRCYVCVHIFFIPLLMDDTHVGMGITTRVLISMQDYDTHVVLFLTSACV